MINKQHQQGAALIITLLLLVTLTFVALTAMESSNLDFRMSMNAVHKESSFNYSESGRESTTEVVDAALFELDWDRIAMPTGLTAAETAVPNKRRTPMHQKIFTTPQP